jgi:hypothetical protein
MKCYALSLLALTFLHSSVSFADDIPKDQSQAAVYFESLMVGNVEMANALIDVPFSNDRKSILKTKPEVAAIHKQLVEQKGKRAIPEYTIAKTDRAPKLDAAVFPKYQAFRLVIEDQGEIDIYVSVGEDPKVIGFSD